MNTNLDALYKSNESLEENGVWFTLSDTVGFLVRRMNSTNPRSKQALAKYFKPFAAQVAAGTLTAKKEREILTQMFVEVAMVDWKGVIVDGKEVPYSPAEAIKLFNRLPGLLDDLRAYAEDPKNYLEELGNS